MREFLRLLYLVVIIIPLAVLLIGPVLILAALRGRQRIGQIVFNPGRLGAVGRLGALVLGLLVSLALCVGLGLILSQVGPPAISSLSSLVFQANGTPTAPLAVPSPAPTALPAVPLQTPEIPTPTHPPEDTPIPSPSATPSLMAPTPTPALPSATATPPAPTGTPTSVPPTATSLPTVTFTPSPAPPPTLSTEQAMKIATVEEANQLLRAAVVEISIGNLAALETLWQGRALAKVQAFAQDLSQRYSHPLEVSFVYLSPPLALEGSSSDTARVVSVEEWTYTGRGTYTERFEFTYTLKSQDEGWVITDYAYSNTPATLSSSEETPTPIPTPTTGVATGG